MAEFIERKNKRKSLRKLVFTWFFILTLIPFAILAVIIQNLYQKSINQEIKNRLAIHIRELESLFEKEHSGMDEFLKNILKNQTLKKSLTQYQAEITKSVLKEEINNFNQKEVKVYTVGGQAFISFNKAYQSIFDQPDLSMKDRLFLEKQDLLHKVLFKKEKNGKRNRLDLSLVRKIVLDSPEDHTVDVETLPKTIGYIETVLPLSFIDLKKISESIGTEVIFFDRTGNVLLDTLPSSFDGENPGPHFLKGRDSFFELMISQVPYAFMSKVVQWGNLGFLMGLGTSKDPGSDEHKKTQLYHFIYLFGFFDFLDSFQFLFCSGGYSPY